MKTTASLCVCAALALTAALPALSAQPARGTLARFETEAELREWLEQMRKRAQPPARAKGITGLMSDSAVAQSAPAPAAPAVAKEAKAEESVTNVQTAGVDEGGIVKVHGEHLVVLRRGRLFTVRIGGNELAPVSTADAFGTGIDPRGAWYDEMLIRGDTIIVIGFSYQRGGTEVGLFDIDRAGGLSHRATYHLRSNDYYSSRNYASRLIGDKLIFYTPLYLNLHGDPFAWMPAMRRWRAGAAAEEFRRIAPATRIYRTDDEVEPWGLTLHTVTTCDLARREMACESTGVLGPAGRVFYVSQGSVYVWTTRPNRDGRGGSSVFRIPLEGAAPTALKTAGSPVDQLSFLESDDGHLNVLLRAHGRGEAMWAAESGSNSMALMRVPMAAFGDGRDAAPASAYRRLPSPAGFTLQNRYVGPFLLYGSGSTWGAPNAPHSRNALHAVRWSEPVSTVQSISLPHGVDRIEAMGRHAVVIGTAGKDLHFSSVRLDAEASVPHRYTRPDAAQGETRTHGFFYRADAAEAGIVGLPVVAGGRAGHRQLRQGSAAVTFLRNDALMLSELGDLAAAGNGSGNGGYDDGCKASCVDWYGNARPLFLRGRIFALLGYEIVEGRLAGGQLSEARRASFAPR